MSSVSETSLQGIVRAMFRPILEGQTYKHLVYLVLAFPLTLLYWSLFGFGMLLGTLLSIVLVGIVILLFMILVVRALVGVERWLANTFLAVSLEGADDVTTGDGIGGEFRGYLDAPSTWRGFGFVSLKFFLGLVGLVLVYGLAQGLSLISAVIRRPHAVDFGEVNGDPVIWTIETIPETVLATGAGVAIVLVVLHLANGFGYVAERMATALLGAPVTESNA